MWLPVVRKKSTAKRTAGTNVGQYCHVTSSLLIKSTPSHEDIMDAFQGSIRKRVLVSEDDSMGTRVGMKLNIYIRLLVHHNSILSPCPSFNMKSHIDRVVTNEFLILESVIPSRAAEKSCINQAPMRGMRANPTSSFELSPLVEQNAKSFAHA